MVSQFPKPLLLKHFSQGLTLIRLLEEADEKEHWKCLSVFLQFLECALEAFLLVVVALFTLLFLSYLPYEITKKANLHLQQ